MKCSSMASSKRNNRSNSSVAGNRRRYIIIILSFFWEKIWAMNISLYFSIIPLAPCLILYIHFEVTIEFPLGLNITSHTSLFVAILFGHNILPKLFFHNFLKDRWLSLDHNSYSYNISLVATWLLASSKVPFCKNIYLNIL